MIYLKSLFISLLTTSALAQCPICHDGSTDTVNLDFAPPEWEDGLTCGQFLEQAQTASNAPSCDDSWISRGLHCGCPVPPGGCPLCANNEFPPNLLATPPEINGLSCNGLKAIAASGVEDLTCQEWLSAGLFCDCPVAVTCPLCQDESALPDPDRTVGLQSCRVLQAFAVFSQGNVCTAWQATAGVYCGCEQNTVEGYCRICGGDQLLPDTNIVAFQDDEGKDVSCGEVEVNEEFVECEMLQSNYGAVCCPTPEPTSSPVQETIAPVGEGEPTRAPVRETISPVAEGEPTTSPVQETLSPVAKGEPTRAPSKVPSKAADGQSRLLLILGFLSLLQLLYV